MRGLTKRYRLANRQLKAARLGQLSFACPADVIVPHARKRDFRERKASVFDQARISRRCRVTPRTVERWMRDKTCRQLLD
jgi:hypothetical protein